MLLGPRALESQSPAAARPSNPPRSGGAAGEMSAEQIFNRFAGRVVFLTCEKSEDESSLASGVLVAPDGFIVTNAHVVGQCRRMTATSISGASRRSYVPTLKYYDEKNDTAVLKIPADSLDSFGVLARAARVGERVYAVGNPRGLEQSISEGIVSGIREDDGVRWIQHSAPISPGSSGGALISARGELLGINSWTRTESQNLNFAVPAATLANALSDARALTGFLDFPLNTGLTGTYSGVVLNRTLKVWADFKIVISESKGAVRGCSVVQPPLLGSGSLQGTLDGLQFSLVWVTDSLRGVLKGERNAKDLSGTYSVIPNGGSEQVGTFVLHKTSAEGLSSGFNVQNCPNDAAVTRPAAEQGNASAQNNLGHLYYNGLGVSRDYAEAARWFRKAAEQGHAEAQSTVGNLFAHGKGLPQDYDEALRWYRKAADQGWAEAYTHLGEMYFQGHGVTQDYAQAVAWLRRAAEQGDARGQFLLGRMYSQGHGVPKDDAEAARWYLKAAEQGNALAQDWLGADYEMGRGVPQDYAQAAAWYRKAAEQGNAPAQTSLGTAYERGRGVPQDYSQAVEWHRKAAEQGDARGQAFLGHMYLQGHGVPQDYSQAAAWYRKAAEQGNADAQFRFGLLYYYGRGLPQDYAEAAHWYRNAAEQGNLSAQCDLGEMYAHVQGVPQDYVEAHMWLNLAASRASFDELQKQAISRRDQVAKMMSAQQISEAQRRAQEWKPKSSADTGWKPAQ